MTHRKTEIDESIDAIITRTRQSFYSDGLWELLAVLSSLLPPASGMEKSVLEITGIYFLWMGTAFPLSEGVTCRHFYAMNGRMREIHNDR
jgi:hypothetical protein